MTSGSAPGARAMVTAACAASFAIGLFFIFVWTPLPWGWKGLDDYHDLALTLARGEPFPTTDVMWGYAWFLAPFYRLFGDRPWIPLCAQAVLNASVPLMLYALVRHELGERAAVAAAVLAGLFSFNTVYASTQSSDAICTVLTVAAVLCFARGDRLARTGWFAAAGLLIGLAFQFRPNLILLPAFLAALYLGRGVRLPPDLVRLKADATSVAAFILTFAAVAAPWIIRTYRWTGLIIPASTHGAKQLWFGSLQTRGYQDSWLYNPRAAFEYPPLDYTSIVEMPIIVTGTARSCGDANRGPIELTWFTGRDRRPRHVTATRGANGALEAEIPVQPDRTAVYYSFEADSPDPPSIVVSTNHVGDLDADGHALDIFDVARMLSHVAWGEPLPLADRLDFDGDGLVGDADVRRAVALIVDNHAAPDRAADPTIGVSHDTAGATVRFTDGSAISVPRDWSGRLTDLGLETPVVVSLAMRALGHSRSFASLKPGIARPAIEGCLRIDDVAANRVVQRRLPHEMRRFTALAMDNIRHDPAGFALASAVRVLRVFVIQGSDDRRTAYQFPGGGWTYTIGRALSLLYGALFVAGVLAARARGLRLFMLLAPIVYVPVTICVMLINARYSMTTQPFVFGFVGLALVTGWEAWRARRRPAAAPAR